jgi:hypothetical protein
MLKKVIVSPEPSIPLDSIHGLPQLNDIVVASKAIVILFI